MHHKKISYWRAVAALAILSLVGPPTVAASFDARHAADLANNPPDLHFRLDTVGGQRAFHIGERIPLTLAFSSDTPAKYKLNAASYDCSGRLPTEEFIMEKEAIDPYLDYFGAGVLGGLAGGIRGYPVLEHKPVKIEVELNQWFRFDLPGHFRFYLKSHRLARESAPGESDRRTVELAAVSNVVEIEILTADASWETMKLTAIKAILDPPGVEQTKTYEEPLISVPPDKHVLLAWRELEYLGTGEAVHTAFDIARKNGRSRTRCWCLRRAIGRMPSRRSTLTCRIRTSLSGSGTYGFGRRSSGWRRTSPSRCPYSSGSTPTRQAWRRSRSWQPAGRRGLTRSCARRLSA
jgi:hypothetical protein